MIHTPIADCFLDGITRRTVIDLAQRRGFEVEERRIMPDELESFNECFITGTAAEVTPVSEIGPYKFQPGNMTKVLMEDYSAEVQPPPRAAPQEGRGSPLRVGPGGGETTPPRGRGWRGRSAPPPPGGVAPPGPQSGGACGGGGWGGRPPGESILPAAGAGPPRWGGTDPARCLEGEENLAA